MNKFHVWNNIFILFQASYMIYWVWNGMNQCMPENSPTVSWVWKQDNVLESAHPLPPPLLPLVLCILQHLLLPQFEEVRRVRVELHPVDVVVSVSTMIKSLIYGINWGGVGGVISKVWLPCDSPVSREDAERGRLVAGVVQLRDGVGSTALGHHLLVLCGGALERLPHVDVLQGD